MDSLRNSRHWYISSRSSRRLATLWAASLVLLLAALPAPLPAASDDALSYLQQVQKQMRGKGSEGVYKIDIVRPEWTRTFRIKSYDDAVNDRFRVEILEPKKLAGTLFAKKDGKLTMYLPKLKRRIAISPAMMHDAWMGSDFNNQDLLEASALISDYQHSFRPTGEQGTTLIESTPKPGLAVSWMRLEQRFGADRLPLGVDYICKRGNLKRRLSFAEPKTFGKRRVPTLWRMQPVESPDQHTLVRIESLNFVDGFPNDLFELGEAEP